MLLLLLQAVMRFAIECLIRFGESFLIIRRALVCVRYGSSLMTFAIILISMSASGLPEDAGNAQREDDNTENKSIAAEQRKAVLHCLFSDPDNRHETLSWV